MKVWGRVHLWTHSTGRPLACPQLRLYVTPSTRQSSRAVSSWPLSQLPFDGKHTRGYQLPLEEKPSKVCAIVSLLFAKRSGCTHGGSCVLSKHAETRSFRALTPSTEPNVRLWRHQTYEGKCARLCSSNP